MANLPGCYLVLENGVHHQKQMQRRKQNQFLKEINQNGTTIILTTHYLEEAEQLCRNIGIIDHGEIVVDTSMKDLLSRLDVQGFVLDLEKPLDQEPKIDGFELRLDDPLTLVTATNKEKSINKKDMTRREFFLLFSPVKI